MSAWPREWTRDEIRQFEENQRVMVQQWMVGMAIIWFIVAGMALLAGVGILGPLLGWWEFSLK